MAKSKEGNLKKECLTQNETIFFFSNLPLTNFVIEPQVTKYVGKTNCYMLANCCYWYYFFGLRPNFCLGGWWESLPPLRTSALMKEI